MPSQALTTRFAVQRSVTAKNQGSQLALERRVQAAKARATGDGSSALAMPLNVSRRLHRILHDRVRIRATYRRAWSALMVRGTLRGCAVARTHTPHGAVPAHPPSACEATTGTHQ